MASLIPAQDGDSRYGPLTFTGAPVAGTDEVQTLTIGGTPDGGSFTLRFKGFTTAAIAWSSTNATLVSNIDAALEALPAIGTGGVATAQGTITNGIGTITLTFSGAALAKRVQPLIEVAANNLTGTSPTVAVAETTAGVDATLRDALPGAIAIRTDTAPKVYVNTQATAGSAPTWTVLGTQS